MNIQTPSALSQPTRMQNWPSMALFLTLGVAYTNIFSPHLSVWTCWTHGRRDKEERWRMESTEDNSQEKELIWALELINTSKSESQCEYEQSHFLGYFLSWFEWVFKVKKNQTKKNTLAFENIKQNKKPGGKQKRKIWTRCSWDPSQISYIPSTSMCKNRLTCLQRSTGLGYVSDDRVSVVSTVWSPFGVCPKPQHSVHSPLAFSHSLQLQQAACHCCHLSDKWDHIPKYATPRGNNSSYS